MTRRPLPAYLYGKVMNHRYGASLAVYLAAAVLTGLACVLFMRVFESVLEVQLTAAATRWCWLATPLLFLLSVELIRVAAPCADGAGIPQTIFAARHIDRTNFDRMHPLVSFRTMAVKVVALLLGLWAGASTGREGPTVHIAACLFFGTSLALHRLLRLSFDMRSAVVAGGAAGLAAAFNTPLAGVTFAIEELSGDFFSNIKDMVLLAIIVAGLAAKTLTGEYVYFGRLAEAAPIPTLSLLLVSVGAGTCGALFSVLLVQGRRFTATLRGWKRVASVTLLAWALVFFVTVPGLAGIAGPGNLVARDYVHGELATAPGAFAAVKMLATLFTYWSGIAGGIFAPCLSMGAAIGAFLAPAQGAPVSACAVIGMAAFLAGTIQAPITSFVIIFEMTDQHRMVLPIMLAALIGYMVARLLKTGHLYQSLASFYERRRLAP